MQTFKKERGEKKNGETRQKWAIITSKRLLGGTSGFIETTKRE